MYATRVTRTPGQLHTFVITRRSESKNILTVIDKFSFAVGLSVLIHSSKPVNGHVSLANLKNTVFTY